MLTRKISQIAVIIWALACWSIASASTSAPQSDVRILIDVSGSMKLNDPRNLRQPSLRLITGLLNNGDNAGIWTFGQYVNMLVTQGPVNEDWKDKARAASKQINSYGLRTNIESVLRDATWDWMKPANDNQQRSLILLTDGLVDISDDIAANQASRKRILDEILPKLKQAGINIHTIALSEDADTELLAQLSAATQGVHTNVKTSKELERVFLHLFEASTRNETLPIHENALKVDASIQEMTILVFHQPHAKNTRIGLPDGNTIDADNNPDNINWHTENNYDLITVQQPALGTWTIVAKMDPDNRVVVVSDLKLETDTIPSNVALDDALNIDIHLSQQGEPIINKDFLHFIKVSAIQYNKLGEQTRQWSLFDNGLRSDRIENDGVYTLPLDQFTEEGQHELIIDIDGTTFTRRQRHRFQVFSQPVITAVETSRHNVTFYAAPIASLIDPDTIEMTARIDDAHEGVTVPKLHQNEWGLTLSDVNLSSPHKLNIHLTGKRNNKDIAIDLEPLAFGRKPITSKVEQAHAPQHHESSHESTVEANTPDSSAHQSNDVDTTSTSHELSPLTVLIDVILFNILGAALIFFLYRKFKPAFTGTNRQEELTNE